MNELSNEEYKKLAEALKATPQQPKKEKNHISTYQGTCMLKEE